METKTKIIIVSIGLIAAFAVGRWAAPEKVRIETKVVEVEKKVEDTKKDVVKHKETHTVKKPDGTEETTTTEDTTTKSDKHDTDSTTTETDTTKEVTRGSSKVTVLALAGLPVSFNTAVVPIYGVSVSKPILGPITIGAWGLSNSTAGFSIGLTF
jgi:hypothetical protein